LLDLKKDGFERHERLPKDSMSPTIGFRLDLAARTHDAYPFPMQSSMIILIIIINHHRHYDRHQSSSSPSLPPQLHLPRALNAKNTRLCRKRAAAVVLGGRRRAGDDGASL
jgi:hypothetical protein